MAEADGRTLAERLADARAPDGGAAPAAELEFFALAGNRGEMPRDEASMRPLMAWFARHLDLRSKALEEAAEDGTLLRVGTDVQVVRESDLN